MAQKVSVKVNGRTVARFPVGHADHGDPIGCDGWFKAIPVVDRETKRDKHANVSICGPDGTVLRVWTEGRWV
ncbi:hypothetical protein [Actinocatenispora sera]|uniref:Uncharacterized protein n=1 Tax=Actinocatenispora sera TaxID=390989 RepID=A0A810KZN7_9ACTN|nr:hypothetical protein [Actinocatenispora sera]BCJ27939.1 hypothetical protein Asera_20470 [Actinocatenispora sera]